jgi:hypothetical protein
MGETLTAIARDPSRRARSKLLAALSDLVFMQRQPTVTEITSLCEVARLVLEVVDESSRSHFAATIAPSKNVPRAMVLLLIEDGIAVAGPLLRESPILTEQDLKDYAERLTDDYLVFIAERRPIGSDVVEILVRRGGDSVRLAVAKNASAKLTPGCLRPLLQTAETSEALCRVLVVRPELSRAEAEHLVQLIARMLKARMIAQAEAARAELALQTADLDLDLVFVDSRLPEPDGPIVPQELPVPIEKPAADATQVKKPPPPSPIADMIADLRAGRLTLDQCVTQLCDEDRFNDLTTLIGAQSQLDDVSVMRLLVRADANGISIVLKALGLSPGAFSSVTALRKRRLRSSDMQTRYERDDYAKLTLAEAKATLDQLAGRTRRERAH